MRNTTQDGKSENNNKKRISEARRILTLQYEYKKIGPLAQINETLEWHLKIEEELIRMNLIEPANQENKL